MEKFDINYIANLQGIHKELLMNNLPHVYGWETGKKHTTVWVTDMSVVDKIPNSLFGLPTKVILIKETYREKTEVIVKTNTISWKDKFELVLVDIGNWLASAISNYHQ
jgi:hypothetical protein